MVDDPKPNPLHPRVAVSGLCFPDLPATLAVAEIGRLGVSKTSMTSAKLRASGPEAVVPVARVRASTTDTLVNFSAGFSLTMVAASASISFFSLTGPMLKPGSSLNECDLFSVGAI